MRNKEFKSDMRRAIKIRKEVCFDWRFVEELVGDVAL